MSESDDTGREDDVVLLHSPTESGDAIRVVRKRQDTIELGELRPMREGQPIHGEVVRLTQREEHAMLFDCEVVVPSPSRKEAEPAALPAKPRAALPAAGASSAASSSSPSPERREPTTVPHKGPPRVTNDAYRGGWDAIFGKRSDKNNAPN